MSGRTEIELIMHKRFYRKAVNAIENFRVDCASGDRKLFKQAYSTEKRLKKKFKLVSGNDFSVRLTSVQHSILLFAIEKCGGLK